MFLFWFLICRRPPRSTRTDTRFPDTTRCRSEGVAARMPRRSRFENQISRASAHAAAGNGVGGPFPIIKWLDEMHAAGSAGPTLQGVDSGDEIVVTKHARVRRGKEIGRASGRERVCQ